MKTILINPPQNTRYPQPPPGLASIAAVLEQKGHQVEILDANALHLSGHEIVHRVKDADAIGITAMTPAINFAIRISKERKEENPELTGHAALLFYCAEYGDGCDRIGDEIEFFKGLLSRAKPEFRADAAADNADAGGEFYGVYGDHTALDVEDDLGNKKGIIMPFNLMDNRKQGFDLISNVVGKEKEEKKRNG